MSTFDCTPVNNRLWHFSANNYSSYNRRHGRCKASLSRTRTNIIQLQLYQSNNDLHFVCDIMVNASQISSLKDMRQLSFLQLGSCTQIGSATRPLTRRTCSTFHTTPSSPQFTTQISRYRIESNIHLRTILGGSSLLIFLLVITGEFRDRKANATLKSLRFRRL